MDYDSETGEIIPKSDLSGVTRQKALHTINGLQLNQLDMRYYRIDWTRTFVEDLLSLPQPDRRAFVEYSTQQPIEYAGVTSMVVEKLRQDGRI